jgi:peroxiredoxin-like protein
MTPLPHTYLVGLEAGPSGYAVLSSAGIPDLRAAAPSDFDGPGDAWSPEHLLIAAVESCFLLTLRGVARASKVEFLNLEMSATGIVNRENGVTHFTEIVLRPRLTLAPGTDRERALRILEKSEKNCLVAASLSTPVRIEPEILEG